MGQKKAANDEVERNDHDTSTNTNPLPQDPDELVALAQAIATVLEEKRNDLGIRRFRGAVARQYRRGNICNGQIPCCPFRTDEIDGGCGLSPRGENEM